MLGSPRRSNHAVMCVIGVLSAVLVLAGLVLAADPTAATEEKAKQEAKQEANQEAKQDTYPLDTCIVTGAKLGSMGDPVIYDYKGREIRFCCSGCVATFEKHPEKYLKKMDQAIIATELPRYPLHTCIVSGDSLGTKGDPIDRVYGNHLVRLCSEGCMKAFEKEPGKYMAILDKAKEAQAAERAPKPYPFNTCLVSGAKLGSMGKPVPYVYNGQELQFCCRGCLSEFKKHPEKYMEKLKATEKAEAGQAGKSKESGGDNE